MVTARDTSPTTNPEPALPFPTGELCSSFDTAVRNIYAELRRFGEDLKKSDHDVTLATTDVVRSICARSAGSPDSGCGSPGSYKKAAARAMRLLLVRAAHKRTQNPDATKQLLRITLGSISTSAFGEEASLVSTRGHVLALDAALSELQIFDSYQADLLEMKYFGGFSSDEIARQVQSAEEKVMRDLRMADAWLKWRLSQPFS